MPINYDLSTKGGAGFDMDDYKYLKDMGYSQSKIDEFAKSQDRANIGAGVSIATGAYRPDVSDLSKYDPKSMGGVQKNGPDINLRELEYLHGTGGHDAKKINDWATDNRYRFTKKAQEFLNNKLYNMNPGGGNNNGGGGDNRGPGSGDGSDYGTGDGGSNGGGGSGGTVGGGGGGGGVNTGDSETDNSQVGENSSDNKWNNEIDGNNNVIYNPVDNSVRNYGGDNRSFTYNRAGDGGGGEYGAGGNWFNDDPVSMATMAGYYDVDDSPAKQAKFTDLYATLNRDNQKRYAGKGLANAKMFTAFDARNYTKDEMQGDIQESIQNSYDRATDETEYTFGDIWREDYAPDKWVMPEDPEKIENDEDLGEDQMDRIDD